MQLFSNISNLSIKSSNDISKYFSLWGFIKKPRSKATTSNIKKNLLSSSSKSKSDFEPSCMKIKKYYNIHN